MSIIVNANKAHETACNLSEMNRQVAVAQAIAAGGGSSVVTLAIKNAEIVHYRNCVASALANGVQSGIFRAALRELGTGGQ